jgi:hypothetical protein
VRYRPLRSKYESVDDYLRLVAWRSDFEPVTRRGSGENPKNRLSRAQSPRTQNIRQENSSPAKLLYEICDSVRLSLSGWPHALAARDGPGRPARAPKPRADLRKRDGGNCGSALDTGTVVTAPRLSCESATDGKWRKSIRDKSLEFTGFHYQRLKRFQRRRNRTIIDPVRT